MSKSTLLFELRDPFEPDDIGEAIFLAVLDDSAPVATLQLITSRWVELGKPKTLTVTIEPGDLLNPPKEA